MILSERGYDLVTTSLLVDYILAMMFSHVIGLVFIT
jgi:hypothetical protein